MTGDPTWMTALLGQFALGRSAPGGDPGAPPPADVDLRPPPAAPTENYLAHPHAELAAMLTTGADPDEVGRRADLCAEAGAALVGFRDAVAAAVADSADGWQGAAGEAARRFLTETGEWAASTGHGAAFAAARLAEQAGALAAARAAMPAERPFDHDGAMADLRATTDPIAFATKAAGYSEEHRRSRAAHEEAARVVAEYDRALAAAADLPAYAPPPTAGSGEQGVRVPPPRPARPGR